MLIFLAVNGHHLLIKALFDSFKVIPLGTAVFSKNLMNDTISVFGNTFVLGFKIGAPVIAAILITDVALGVMSKTIPQLNVFVVGMPIKIMLGLIVMLLTVPMLAGIIGMMVSDMKLDLYEFIRDMVQIK
jgi:flagellar biosynthetic protein FliR